MKTIETIKKAQKDLESKISARFNELNKIQSETQAELKELLSLAQVNGIKLGKTKNTKAKSTKPAKTGVEPSSKDIIIDFVKGSKVAPYIKDIQNHVVGFGYSEAGVPVTVSTLVKTGTLKKDKSEGPKKTKFILA